jgi:hypothetical protein
MPTSTEIDQNKTMNEVAENIMANTVNYYQFFCFIVSSILVIYIEYGNNTKFIDTTFRPLS